jgi:hypothetical protein
MKIEWSPEAAADFAGIVAYIHQQNPSAADRVAHSMYDSAASLESDPQFKAKTAAAMKARWADPEFRAKMLAALKEDWARRKAEKAKTAKAGQ